VETSARLTYGLLDRWAGYKNLGANFILSYRFGKESPWSFFADVTLSK